MEARCIGLLLFGVGGLPVSKYTEAARGPMVLSYYLSKLLNTPRQWRELLNSNKYLSFTVLVRLLVAPKEPATGIEPVPSVFGRSRPPRGAAHPPIRGSREPANAQPCPVPGSFGGRVFRSADEERDGRLLFHLATLFGAAYRAPTIFSQQHPPPFAPTQSHPPSLDPTFNPPDHQFPYFMCTWLTYS